MWPAPCSWRASTWRTVVPRANASYVGQDRAAREAEGDVDALGLERAEDRVGAVHLSCDRLAVELGVRHASRQLRRARRRELARRRADAGRRPGPASGRRCAQRLEHRAGERLARRRRSPSPSPSISAAASSIDAGLATPWPAMSSAAPCAGAKTLGPLRRGGPWRRPAARAPCAATPSSASATAPA